MLDELVELTYDAAFCLKEVALNREKGLKGRLEIMRARIDTILAKL